MKFNEQSNLGSEQKEKELRNQERLQIYKELIENAGFFNFPGINPERYKRMKQGDGEDIYGMMTPTDTLIDRFSIHGVRFADMKFPESGNVFIIPGDSIDIIKDGILLQNLNLEGVEDQNVRRLIELCQ